jgi:beta-catenin-like protein 1
VENCFDALCSAMLLDDNKARPLFTSSTEYGLTLSPKQAQFVAAEGVELMLLVIRGKGPAKGAALRCLDFAVTRCAPAASRLVAAGGLGAVFAAFSGRSAAAARSRRGADAPDAEEARAVSLLASALQLLPRGAPRDRVAAKFVEEEFSKVDRLVELWFKYAQRVATAEQSWDADAANDDEDGADEDEDGDDERYAARMDAGLYTLQQLALILAQLWCVGHPGLCGRAAQALQLGGGAMAAVRSVLREHATALGDAEGEEARDALRLKVLRLADTLYLPGEAHSRSASDAEDDDDVAGEEAERPGGAAEAAEGMLDEDE